ncbi:MAG: hypothetical protein K5984_04045 [Bacteroidales bacterium]|nr:hypothetical protein [Bacteroidales bacterium]
MRKVFAIFILAAASAAASAQDFRFVQESQPWLTGNNAAGLTRFSGNKISIVEGMFRKDDGGLIGIEGSDDSFETGLSTESYLNFSDRIVFYGGLSWSWFKGQNMGGSIFMDPSYNSFNVIETSTETAGIKTRELYDLTGGLGYRLSDKVSLGGKINYECGDQTKRKDPRTLNKWMDMGLSAGLMWTPSETFRIGADLRYRRTLEQITAGQYGANETNYVLYVDYGAGLSVKELFDTDENHISTSSSRPMSNTFYGAGIQFGFGDRTKFENEVTILHRTGYFGKKSSTTVVFEEFDGNEFRYEGNLLIPSAGGLNKVSLGAGLSTLANYRNIYTKVYTSGEETTITYSEPQKSLSRNILDLNAGFSRYAGINDDEYGWKYGLDADLKYKDQKTTYYPYYRKQNYVRVAAEIFGERKICVSKGSFTLEGRSFFSFGSGTAAEDGAYASTSSSSIVSADSWAYWQYYYETLSRAGLHLGVRYTRPLMGVKAYIGLQDTFTSLLEDSEYLPGKTRNTAKITIGCIF